MANDTHKDGWRGFGDLAVRIGDRDYRSKDLRNLAAAYSPQAIASARHELFGTGTVADIPDAIARLKLDAVAIAENLTRAEAMAMLHEIGLVVHKAAQR